MFKKRFVTKTGGGKRFSIKIYFGLIILIRDKTPLLQHANIIGEMCTIESIYVNNSRGPIHGSSAAFLDRRPAKGWPRGRPERCGRSLGKFIDVVAEIIMGL